MSLLYLEYTMRWPRIGTEQDEFLERYHELHLRTPQELDANGYPKLVTVVGLVLNGPRNRALKSTTDLDRAITRILSPQERQAYLHDRRYFGYDLYCALCGGAFDVESCLGCGATFKYDGISGGGYMAMPPRVRAWLIERGHRFTR